MELWEIILSCYGLIVSPVIGVGMLIKRFNGAYKSGGGLLVYLLVGLVNIGAIVFTMVVLPEESWLKSPAFLVLLFYLGIFGAPQYIRDLK